MATKQNLYHGLFKSDRKSIYDIQTEIKDNRLNLGRNFSKDLLFNSISPSIYKNTFVSDFIVLLQNILVKYINGVSYLKIFKNYTVDKNYKKVK